MTITAFPGHTTSSPRSWLPRWRSVARISEMVHQ
jgi:hypothetical protein